MIIIASRMIMLLQVNKIFGVNMEWQFADAKNQFDDVVNFALSKGPQYIKRGKDIVIILSQHEYDKLAGKRPNFKDFLMGKSPTLEGLDIKRNRSPTKRSCDL